MTRLAGRVAFITGAARGIGRACALRMAEEGADLVLTDIGVVARLESVYHDLATPADLDRTATLARERGSTVVTRYVDVRDGAALRAAVKAGVAQLGPIDIAVPAAGVGSTGRAWELTDAQWRTAMDVNLTGAWQTAKAVAPVMIDSRSGSIVFIGSTTGHRAQPGRTHQAATAHGVVGLVRSFAQELAPFNVRANSVDVGEVATEISMSQESLDARAGRHGATVADVASLALEQHAGRRLPLPWIDPVDVANAVVFLASEEARCVTGSSLVIDLGAMHGAAP